MLNESGVESAMYPEMLAQFEAGAEKAKNDLARKLHDELGGFLVAAVMDTAWAEQNLEATDEARVRLKRARKSLSAAVDLKRGLIEKLRPTLLDTFGLLAALRWQHKHVCADAGLECQAELPDEEPPFTGAASISLFRIAQEALAFAARQAGITSIDMLLETLDGQIHLEISCRGVAESTDEKNGADLLSLWLIENRVKALGGELSIDRGAADSGLRLLVIIPQHAISLDPISPEHNVDPAGQAPTPA